jgi:hypothetical protein
LEPKWLLTNQFGAWKANHARLPFVKRGTATRRLAMARVQGRRVRAGIGAAVAAAGLSALTLVAPTPAGAGGGDAMDPDRDRYEPGQQVTLVGYVEAVAVRRTSDGPVTHAEWRTPGPYYAYLRVDRAAVERDLERGGGGWPFVHPSDVRVGRLLVEDGRQSYASLRVGVTFRLPEHLPPDVYGVVVCNDPCTTTLGWLIDSGINVGVDPESPVVRDWPLDEPLIRYLDGTALLLDPLGQGDDLDDWTVTAAEIRAGYGPAPTTVPLVPSEPEPAATAATTKPPVSEAVVDAGQSPAGRAGADPAGGIPSEVVAWLMGFGVLLVVWCLAWRWRPQETRMVVRQGNGQHGAAASDDDPRRVHIKL